MIEVVLFNDHATVRQWLKLRALDADLVDDLPAIGFTGFSDGTPVCAGFLRRLESNAAQIDSLITNPQALPEIRNQAIDLVVVRLIEEAKLLGLKQLIAFSTDAHTLERAKKHGFKHLPHTVIALNLTVGT